jgi:hypothetical protein
VQSRVLAYNPIADILRSVLKPATMEGGQQMLIVRTQKAVDGGRRDSLSLLPAVAAVSVDYWRVV